MDSNTAELVNRSSLFVSHRATMSCAVRAQQLAKLHSSDPQGLELVKEFGSATERSCST